MRKMKLYVPGLLSLILLLPLLFYKLSQWKSFDKQHCLEINYVTPDSPYPNMASFPPSKDYTDINITGNLKDENIKIAYSTILLRQMVEKFDTVNGVHFVFADTAKYESFIKILNFCDQRNAILYLAYENDFWAFNRFKKEDDKKNMLVSFCGFMRNSNCAAEIDILTSFFDYKIDKRFWPIGFIFLLLIGSTLYSNSKSET